MRVNSTNNGLSGILAVIIALLTTGCDVEYSPEVSEDCHGYGCDYTGVTPSGIKYRADLKPGQWGLRWEDVIEAGLKNAALCLGVEPKMKALRDGAQVVFTDEIPDAYGGYYYNDGFIVVRIGQLTMTRINTEHEFVHALVDYHYGDLLYENSCYPHGTTQH